MDVKDAKDANGYRHARCMLPAVVVVTTTNFAWSQSNSAILGSENPKSKFQIFFFQFPELLPDLVPTATATTQGPATAGDADVKPTPLSGKSAGGRERAGATLNGNWPSCGARGRRAWWASCVCTGPGTLACCGVTRAAAMARWRWRSATGRRASSLGDGGDQAAESVRRARRGRARPPNKHRLQHG